MSSLLWGYSTSGVGIIEVVVSIEVEVIIVVTTEPRRPTVALPLCVVTTPSGDSCRSCIL